MVVDTSAILALLFDEPVAMKVADVLNEHKNALIMSTVNLAEVLIRLRDRLPEDHAELEQKLARCSIEYVPPSIRQAQIAASARLRFPLNLGDCFAYALAFDRSLPLLALDQDFRRTDVSIVHLPA